MNIPRQLLWARPVKKARIWSAVLLGALSSGCGGGGGGGSAMQSSPTQSSPTPYVLESAPAPAEPFNIPSQTLTASSAGNSYTAIYCETPNNGTTMFAGQEANSSTISLTITEKNGSPIVTEIDTVYYLENPYQPLGLILSSNAGQFDFLYNSTNPLPSTLTAGSSGPLGSGTYYLSGTNDAVGSLTETYSVTSNNSDNALVLTTYRSGTVNGSSVNETITYIVYSSGAVALQSVQLTVNGMALTFGPPSGPWDY
jgi:hypothetical protein